MTINITERLEWLNKRLGLSKIHKEYIGFQMKELALEVKQKTEQELKPDLLHNVSHQRELLNSFSKHYEKTIRDDFIDSADIESFLKEFNCS